ncbi:hypothetical protein Efla_001490 [Eimeria flavescens]
MDLVTAPPSPLATDHQQGTSSEIAASPLSLFLTVQGVASQESFAGTGGLSAYGEDADLNTNTATETAAAAASDSSLHATDKYLAGQGRRAGERALLDSRVCLLIFLAACGLLAFKLASKQQVVGPQPDAKKQQLQQPAPSLPGPSPQPEYTQRGEALAQGEPQLRPEGEDAAVVAAKAGPPSSPPPQRLKVELLREGLDEATLRRELDECMRAASQLEVTWGLVSSGTKKSFAEHFMSSTEGRLNPSQCMNPFRRLIHGLSKVDISSDSPAQRKAMRKEMQIVTILLLAAERRLRLLDSSRRYTQEAGLYSSVHGLPGRLPNKDVLKRVVTDLKPFSYLSTLLKGTIPEEATRRRGSQKRGSAAPPAIPRVLAQKVAAAIRIREMEAAADEDVIALMRGLWSLLQAGSPHQQQQQQEMHQQEQGEEPGWVRLRTEDRPFPSALFGDLVSLFSSMQQTEAASRQQNQMRPHMWTVERAVDFIHFSAMCSHNKLKTAASVKLEIQKNYENQRPRQQLLHKASASVWCGAEEEDRFIIFEAAFLRLFRLRTVRFQKKTNDLQRCMHADACMHAKAACLGSPRRRGDPGRPGCCSPPTPPSSAAACSRPPLWVEAEAEAAGSSSSKDRRAECLSVCLSVRHISSPGLPFDRRQFRLRPYRQEAFFRLLKKQQTPLLPAEAAANLCLRARCTFLAGRLHESLDTSAYRGVSGILYRPDSCVIVFFAPVWRSCISCLLVNQQPLLTAAPLGAPRQPSAWEGGPLGAPG